MAFLGTPFQGSHEGFFTAAQLRVAVALTMRGETANELVDYLRNDDRGRRELDDLVHLFCEMVNNNRSKFPIVCFYERLQTDFTKVVRDLPPEFAKRLNNCTGTVSCTSS